MGMPAPGAADIEAAVARAKASSQASDRRAPGPAASVRPGRAHNTMLGVHAPTSDAAERTDALAESEDEDLALLDAVGGLRRRSATPAFALWVLALGVIAFLMGGVALAFVLFQGGRDIRAQVVQGENGEELEVEVPGAPAGMRVRFLGQEKALSASRARFALGADTLRLGDNELHIDVVDRGGQVESHRLRVDVELRVRADLGPLASVPPAIDVVVEAPPGSEASLDGRALALDRHGHGSRRHPIDGADANAEGWVEHVVRYRIHPPRGEVAQGELHTRIPLTTLQIDRPGARVVTDAESIEVAGAVPPQATVRVGEETVPVREGRFVHRLTLPELGERSVEVVAQAPDRAPRHVTLVIRRVADLAAEAARFEADAEVTYERLAQNPNIYRGRSAGFAGLVYNVDVRQGHSVLQMLVDPCASGQQCPLWVTYPMATEVERGANVRVLGTVGGEQQFRTQSGQVRTVPRIDAQFVLPRRR